jgi:putative membrane protein
LEWNASSMIVRVVAYIVGSMVAILAVGTLFQSSLVEYESERAVWTFGVALGLLTAFIKPVVSFISLPITCLTFGLFALVINGGLFALAAYVTPGLDVTLWGAVVGGIFAAVINGVIYSVVDEKH